MSLKILPQQHSSGAGCILVKIINILISTREIISVLCWCCCICPVVAEIVYYTLRCLFMISSKNVFTEALSLALWSHS